MSGSKSFASFEESKWDDSGIKVTGGKDHSDQDPRVGRNTKSFSIYARGGTYLCLYYRLTIQVEKITYNI